MKEITVEHDDWTPGCTSADMRELEATVPRINNDAMQADSEQKPRLILRHDGIGLVGAIAVFGDIQ